MPEDYTGTDILDRVVSELCESSSYQQVYHKTYHDVPMPSPQELGTMVEKLRQILFPGYFGNSELRPEVMRYYIGTEIDQVYSILSEQIRRGYCFECNEAQKEKWSNATCSECDTMAHETALKFIERLPYIRSMLATDVRAAYEGDPAAKSMGEAIFCYPSITAVTNQRIAHELLKLEVPLIPRMITEMAHAVTGIDVHPGAEIGERFFIDHGTGTVIGETCIIGKNVRLYHGVTLGAKSFPLDKNGRPIKGIARHPIVDDNVIIYAGATLLGRIRIGAGSEIGGNVWLTHSVPPGSRIMQARATESLFESGLGI